MITRAVFHFRHIDQHQTRPAVMLAEIVPASALSGSYFDGPISLLSGIGVGLVCFVCHDFARHLGEQNVCPFFRFFGRNTFWHSAHVIFGSLDTPMDSLCTRTYANCQVISSPADN